MLAVTLRFLAGASPLDLRLIYGIASKDGVYRCIWRVVDAVNQQLRVHFPIDDPEGLEELESDFAAASSAPGV